MYLNQIGNILETGLAADLQAQAHLHRQTPVRDVCNVLQIGDDTIRIW